MKELALIRGIPGSGKSTFAKEAFQSYDHFEADMWFTNQNGDYCWNPHQIPWAHQWCQNMARRSMFFRNNVVVSNTFVKIWSLNKYFELAKEFGYNVTVYRMAKEYKSVHNIPEETLVKMKNEFENCPGEYIIY